MTNIATNSWIWFGFSAFILLALLLDSFVLYKKVAHPYQSVRASLIWTMLWILIALIFNVLLWIYLNETTTKEFANQKALDFLAGYLIEKSLSIDNLFAFYIIFQQLHIPLKSQQRVFNYGVYSAIVLRLILILCGVWLIERFHWVLYLMGAFLLFTAIKMLTSANSHEDEMPSLQTNRLFKFLQRHMRFTHEIVGEKFFIKRNRLIYATPLMLALIFIELSDIAFAFDSIPAIFAITRDPFIVWASNIFAILGLRALYFFIANIVQKFYLLKYGIAAILFFVGGKILLMHWITIPVALSLTVIVSLLILFSVLSIIFAKPIPTRKR